MRAFVSAPDRGAFVYDLAEGFHRFLTALVECPVPVVAGVTGWAVGAGMSIVCATDLAVAGHSTKLRPAYPGIGFSPDGGMSWTLPRIVGAGRARHILLTDQVLDADTAFAAGIFTAVVADESVVKEAAPNAWATAWRCCGIPKTSLRRGGARRRTGALNRGRGVHSCERADLSFRLPLTSRTRRKNSQRQVGGGGADHRMPPRRTPRRTARLVGFGASRPCSRRPGTVGSRSVERHGRIKGRRVCRAR